MIMLLRKSSHQRQVSATRRRPGRAALPLGVRSEKILRPAGRADLVTGLGKQGIAPARWLGAPTPSRRRLNVTASTPTHSLQGKDHGPLTARSGPGPEPERSLKSLRKSESGTMEPRLEPMPEEFKALIRQGKSRSGTMEPWNRAFPYARGRARVVTFHGSMVPEGYIHQFFQWIGLIGERFQRRFHGSSDICGGQNGRQA